MEKEVRIGAHPKGIHMAWECGRGIFKLKHLVMRHVRFEAEEGTRVLLWHDKWCGEEAFEDTFPTLLK